MAQDNATTPPIVVDPATGHMTMWGMPAWLMSPQYYAEMQGELEVLSGKAAKGVLYRVAFRSGRRAAEGLRLLAVQSHAGVGVEALLQRLRDLALAAGHGVSEVTVSDVGKREVTWVIRESLLATLHAPSKDPVCHYYEGFLAGFVSEILGAPVEGVETECRAQGDARCAFRTKPAAASPV